MARLYPLFFQLNEICVLKESQMTNEHKHVLLIGSTQGAWRNILVDAMNGDGDVECINAEDVAKIDYSRSYTLYIVDGTFVFDLALMITSIRTNNRKARILVVAGSPDWRMVRDSIKAGAVDIIKIECSRGYRFCHDQNATSLSRL